MNIMEARNFEEDLNNSNNSELRKEWIKIFKLKFGDDCEICWKDDISTQKGFGTDITIKTKKGRRYSVELKTRKFGCNNNYIMEIINHVYDKEDKETRTHLYSYEGWLYTCTAEYLFHATLDESGKKIINVIFYTLMPFKNPPYKSEFNKYELLWLPTRNVNSFQWTINKLIPKEVIKRDALEFWEWQDESKN